MFAMTSQIMLSKCRELENMLCQAIEDILSSHDVRQTCQSDATVFYLRFPLDKAVI